MHKNTKKERVERYLANLMKTDDFTVDDLMNLTVYDLFGNAELEGIGKTTLSSGISAFKKKYLKIQYDEKAVEANSLLGGPAKQGGKTTDEESEEDPFDDQELFENAVISTLEKEGDDVESEIRTEVKAISENLDISEISVLKTMISQFKSGLIEPNIANAGLELSELKKALKHFGIEYNTILAQYRKVIEN